MANFPGRIALLLACSIAANGFAANSVTHLSLSEVADTALHRQASTSPGAGGIPYQSSSWLAALPSVGLAYLGSDENQGTDETELSLNLPFKSGAGRKLDRELRLIAEDIDQTELQRRRLYLSGLIREALWTHRIVSTRAAHSQKKIVLLEELQERQQALFDARSASRYQLLLIQQELTDARIILQEYDWQADTWRQRYRQLTGLGSIPTDIVEGPAPADLDYTLHPELRLLDLGWQRQQKLIAAGSAKNEPWNVAVTAKQLDNPQLDEKQYGVALEIPLSLFDITSESTRGEWQDASRGYWQLHDELQLDLSRRWQRLQSEASYLLARQSMLDESALIGSQLLNETSTMMDQNELGREIWLRRALKDIDNQASAAINKLLTGQNRAMTRQAAGIPL